MGVLKSLKVSKAGVHFERSRPLLGVDAGSQEPGFSISIWVSVP